jgi:hypothetical protein
MSVLQAVPLRVQTDGRVNTRQEDVKKMRKLIVLVAMVGVLAFGSMAMAEWGGGRGYGPGHGGQGAGLGNSPQAGGKGMMGQGMMGQGGCRQGGEQGFGPGFGPGAYLSTESGKKFFAETADLRRQIHDKMFDLREAYVTGNEEAANAIEQEIDALQEQIAKKAKEAGIDTNSLGYGPMGRGFGPRMMWR